MAAGEQVTQVQINAKAAALAIQFRTLTRDARAFNDFIAKVGGKPGLMATYGFSDADAGNIVSGISDLALLADISDGIAALPATKNFFAYCAWLWGVGP